MTPPVQPRSTIAASIAASPSAPGIRRGRPGGSSRRRTSPATPTSPNRAPVASKIERRNRLVTVLPHVPVTPTVTSCSDGSPARRLAEPRAARPRESGTTTWSRPASGQGRSTTTPAAPRSSAWPTNACPSCRDPRTATNTWPGSSRRLSAVQPETSQSRHPTNRASGSSRRKADRGDPPLGQTVNEPARHRLSPPCQPSIPASPGPGCSASHPEGGGIFGQDPKKAMPDWGHSR